ncbi:MAG: lamin tail domain-containing protein [Candidatus Krumholzibacteriota bacterium]|nr:lamin tail domain-containing protein [Candidatus Krumholzibacteriota bacterium]
MMRMIQILLLAAMQFSSRALSCDISSGVVINEVYYDHPGVDSGWEFIELLNMSDSAIDLSGHTLEAVDGRTGIPRFLWASPAGLILDKAEILLIAGECRVVPDYLILQGDIENGPDGIRLCRSDSVIDRVGYGELEVEDLYESIPAVDAEDGFSLARKPDGHDSNINCNDFVEAHPTPGRRNWYSQDIEIRLDKNFIILCNNKLESILVSIENAGLERFKGEIYLQIVSGLSPVTQRFPVEVDLPPGAYDFVEMSMFFSSLQYGAADLVASGNIDENPCNDSCRVVLVESPSDLVINEIMYRPLSGRSEWIELYNRTVREVDISGWKVIDAAGNEGDLEAGRIEGNGFLIIADDGGSFMDEYPEFQAGLIGMEGDLPALNDQNSGEIAESVELRDAGGGLVDRVSYRDLSGGERGRSIERLSPEVCSSSADGIWHRCSFISGASPGEQNSVYISDDISSFHISISPNPFNPSETRYTEITGKCRRWESGFSVSIFDLRGIRIRRVFSERNGAKSFTCRWDGKSEDKRCLRAGLYLCVVEFTGSGGSVCRREKACVVLSEPGR